MGPMAVLACWCNDVSVVGCEAVLAHSWRLLEMDRRLLISSGPIAVSSTEDLFVALFSCALERVARSVTANIGWYVVSILHDQPSCNVDITWPIESILWVKFVLISIQICVFPFSCRYYMIGISCNIDST